MLAADGMENEGLAPGIEQSALCIDAGMGAREDGQTLRVVADEGVHDVGVFLTGGEAAEFFAIEFEDF